MVVGLGQNATQFKNTFEVVDLSPSAKNCTGPLPYPHNAFRAVAGIDSEGRLFCCGGRINLSMYNIDCNTYINGVWTNLYNLTEARYFAAMSKVTLCNGTDIQVITGGLNINPDGTSKYLSSIDIIGPSGLSLYSLSLPVPMYSHCQVTINCTHIMVASGIQNGINYVPNTWYLDVILGIWTVGPPLNTGRNGHRCIRMQQNYTILTGGISGNTPALATTEVLGDTDTAWEVGPTMPVGVTASFIVKHPLGGCVLVGGNGNNPPSNGLSKSMLELPDLSSQWSNSSQTLQDVSMGHVAVMVPDSMVSCN